MMGLTSSVVQAFMLASVPCLPLLRIPSCRLRSKSSFILLRDFKPWRVSPRPVRGFVASLRTRTSPPFICPAFKWTAPCSHARNRDSLNQFRRKYAENSKCRALFTTPTTPSITTIKRKMARGVNWNTSSNLLLENYMETSFYCNKYWENRIF